MSLNLGIIASSRSSAPSASLLLDTYSGASVAYSFRKLRSAYTGAAIRVRRSSDNTESDISFVANELDIVTLLSFVGANNGFISIWYDQSGNGINATQTTLANQPQIVNNGVINVQDGKPCVIFNGTSNALTAGVSNISGVPLTIISLQKSNKSTGTQTIFRSGTPIVYQRYENTNFSTYGGNNNFNSLTTITPTNRILTESYFTSTTLFQYVNGIISNNDTDGSIGTGPTFPYYIGYYPGFSEYFSGNMQELIVYNSVQTTNRDGIDLNINTYYSIYTPLPSGIITTGLILNLDAGNSASYPGTGTTWTDISGQNNTGTLVGSPTYNSSPGDFTFVANKNVTTALSNIALSSATFIAWVYPTEAQSQYTGIIFNRSGNGGSIAPATGLQIASSSQVGYSWNDNVSTYNWGSNLILPSNQWSMIAITVSSTKATAYICRAAGITLRTNTVSHASLSGMNFFIACDPLDKSARAFKGRIAISMIYNTEMTSANITQNFNTQKSRFGL